MRRRPVPNQRRGLLRAAAAVIILLIVAVAVVLIFSSISATPARAPVAPATPGPLGTPSGITPGVLTPNPVTTPQTKARPTPAATKASSRPSAKKKKKTLGLGPLSNRSRGLAERSGAGLLMRIVRAKRRTPGNAVASPSRGQIAYFKTEGSAYAATPLLVRDSRNGRVRVVGHGDALVPPVWSSDGSRLLYVRVREVQAYPGAVWSLVEGSIRTSRTQVLTQMPGLSLWPLGFTAGTILFTLATEATTDIYSYEAGAADFYAVLAPQTVPRASLSPDGRVIAMVTPVNCGWCGVQLYNLGTLSLSFGPYGMPNASTFAWSTDSRYIVVEVRRQLVAINTQTGSRLTYSLPAGLSRDWHHVMLARVTGQGVTLTDTVTNATYRGARAQHS